MRSTGATNLIGHRRTRRLAGASLAGILVLTSACSGAGRNQARTPSPAEKTAAQTIAPGQEKLAKFYKQDLAWSDCGPHQCAKLVVPIDYSRPDGDTIKLALLKAPATSSSERIGSLVVNPGGPGGSGVEYASHADEGIVTKAVREAYDIVGFDPRGVGD